MESLMNLDQTELHLKTFCLQKFRLYETFSHIYLIGRGKNKSLWRVLKIDRMEPSELNISEDSESYSAKECSELLKRLHEGNRSMGGLKFLTTCYGIIGFIKFMEPYHMLLITERKMIGEIFGEKIYGITKTKMITISNPTVRSKIAYSDKENRYKRLLNTVDLTKDFFFSYSYHVMRSLQKNLSDYRTGQFIYDTMFVWNEFLTREVRKKLKNTLWTVALVYGFFKQIKLSVSSKDFRLTLIARRSRHYAGTRFLRRGVNASGKVANDVETEQIIFEESPEGDTLQISSVVQNRGSIPLHWSQETSLLKIFKPVIILPKQDNYKATKLHFKNLVYRYGNPIIILDLTKTREKKPRETILRTEYANAIGCINSEYPEHNRLKFLQWDLKQHSRSKATDVLEQLRQLTEDALELTGIFCCQVKAVDMEVESEIGDESGKYLVRPRSHQKGVLRSNCIDCLDRTNVAQFAYGLVALGRQLRYFGILESPIIGLDDPVAKDLMGIYETMGDKLSLQYGGSPAHNKIFCRIRDLWKPAIEYLDIIKTVQRFVNNAYMDTDKQNAIDVFLGNPPPQKRKLELDPDRRNNSVRISFKRSLSDSNILWEGAPPTTTTDIGEEQPLSEKPKGVKKGLIELMPETSTYVRYTSSDFRDVDWPSESESSQEEEIYERTPSKFLDMDWFSESECSLEEHLCERLFSGHISTDDTADHDGFPFCFERWVANGGVLFR